MSLVIKSKKKTNKLADLWNCLLPMLMNGQVTVEENTSISELPKRAKERKQRMKDKSENMRMVAEEEEEYKKEHNG